MESISVPRKDEKNKPQGYLSHSEDEQPKLSPAQQFRMLRKDLVTFNNSEESSPMARANSENQDNA